jgi:predicted phosphate transport protein (TIGR00153 family)
MKFGKDKENQLEGINREFLSETLNGSAILYEAVSEFISGKLDQQDLEKIIEIEHKCDEIKDQYVKILYRDKRALPFLVEDRYNILMMIDQVNDKMEFFARFLKTYPFKLYDEIKDEFRDLCSACSQSVEELIDCATLIETDFEGAYNITFQIEEQKRKARKAKFDLLEKLFKMDDNPLKVYLTSKIVTYLYDITSWVEETSDYLRGLIIKYPSR